MQQDFALLQERHSEILQRLQRDGRVLANDLARVFGTSEDTIRRDLRDLAGAGLCQRVYGGALRLSPARGPLNERAMAETDSKAALARAAAALLCKGQTVIIDSGSTNVALARALPEDAGLTIVTNAPGVASVLLERRCGDVIVLGGRVDPRIGASFGVQPAASMSW